MPFWDNWLWTVATLHAIGIFVFGMGVIFWEGRTSKLQRLEEQQTAICAVLLWPGTLAVGLAIGCAFLLSVPFRIAYRLGQRSRPSAIPRATARRKNT